MFVLSVLAMLPMTKAAFLQVSNDYFNKFAEHSVASSVVGGTLMGLGMTISGSVVFTLLCCD